MIEQVSDVYIDNEAVARGERLKELIKGDFVYNGRIYTENEWEGDNLAVRDGKIFTPAAYKYPSIARLRARVLEVGRSLDMYKVGLCPWEEGYTPWFELKSEAVGHPLVVSLALKVITLEDQLKQKEGENK
jgi:hypothetical protein